MAIIYSGFQVKAEALLDSRQMVENSDKLLDITCPCEGLLVWAKAESSFYVYKEDRGGWIQMPLVIPTTVDNPIDGSVRLDPQTMRLLIYYGGSWYGIQAQKINE